MLVKIETQCPPENRKKAIELMPKMGKRPDYIKRTFEPVVFRTHNGGLHQILVYDIADEKLAEGIRLLAKRYSVFDDIPGYSIEMQIVFTQAEAISMMA